MTPDVCCLGHRCFFPFMFLMLTNVLLYINEDKKEPKQHQTCVIWDIGLFPPLFFMFLILTNVLLYIQVITYGIHDMTVVTMRKCPNDTRYMSFGP